MTKEKNNLSSLLIEASEFRKEIQKRQKEFLTKALKIVFETQPEVKGITWVQYIPSFNDGEPCEFTRGCVYFVCEKENANFEDETGTIRKPDSKTLFEATNTAGEEINFFGTSFPERYNENYYFVEDRKFVEILNLAVNIQDLFGSNVAVFITPELEFLTRDYECGY